MIKLPPDITFVVQIIAFLVFWQVMKALLFQPLQETLKARRARTSGGEQQADALRAEAAQLSADIEARLAAARAEGAREADAIRRRAEVEEQELLARQRAESGALLEQARAEIAREVEQARAPLAAEADRLAAVVVEKVLGRAA